MNDKKSPIYQTRIIHLARAALRRAADAGIPPAYMRIGQDGFAKLLSKTYYAKYKTSVESIAARVFDRPESLLKIPFILVDGGTREERKKAGFAILFRLISCDKSGHYTDCTELIHKLQNMDTIHEMTRDERADAIKRQDIVFVGDFRPSPVRPYSEGCVYLDEILEHRLNYRKPTIISFYAPLSAMKDDCREGVNDSGLYGIYMEQFANEISNSTYETTTTLRIHVGVD